MSESENKSEQGVVRQGIIYAVGNVLSRLGGFVLLPLYLRVLTPSEYGVLEMFYAISAVLATFISGGLSQAALRFYFEYDDARNRHRIISTAVIAALAFSGTAALILWPVAGHASKLLVGTPDYASSFRLVLLTLIVQMVSEVGLNYLRVRNQPVKFVMASLGQLVLQVVINLLTVSVLKWGVSGVLLGNLVGAAISSTVVLYFTLSECGIGCSFDKLAHMLKYTWPMVIAGIFGVMLDRSDRFILENTLGLEAVGVYALAEKLAMMVSIGFLQPFKMVYGVYRFSIIRHPGRSMLQSQTLRYYLLGICLLSVVIVAFAPGVLRIISQPSYWTAAALLPILLLRYIFSGTEYVFQTGILYERKTKYSMVIHIVSGSLRVGFTLLFVGSLGLITPAYAVLLGASMAALASLWISRRFDPVNWNLPVTGRVLIATIACFALSRLPNENLLESAGIVGLFVVSCMLLKVVSASEVRAGFGYVTGWWRTLRGGSTA